MAFYVWHFAKYSVNSFSKEDSLLRTAFHAFGVMEEKRWPPRIGTLVAELRKGLHNLYPTEVDKSWPADEDALASLWRSTDMTSLADLRTLAMVQVGFSGLFRVGELADLTWDDVHWEADPVVVDIRDAKTQRHTVGRGQYTHLVDVPGKPWVAAAYTLRRYRDTLVAQGFSAVGKTQVWYNWGTRRKSTSATANATIRLALLPRLAHLAGDQPKVTCHSLRAGGMLFWMRQKVPWLMVKQLGRWSSDAAEEYWRQTPSATGALWRDHFRR